MTSKEWEIAKKAVEGPCGSVSLMVDGYRIDLYLMPTSPYTNEIAVYVNGSVRVSAALGKSPEDQELCRRFFRPSTKCFVKKPKGRLSRKEQALYEEYRQSCSVTTYFPFWNSFDSLKRHFIKNNTNISIIE